MIYEELTKTQFRDAFTRAGRHNQFSYEGLGALYDFLDDLGDDYSLDVIALCCEYTESTIQEALESYDLESIEELESNTIVIYVDDETIIYQAC